MLSTFLSSSQLTWGASIDLSTQCQYLPKHHRQVRLPKNWSTNMYLLSLTMTYPWKTIRIRIRPNFHGLYKLNPAHFDLNSSHRHIRNKIISTQEYCHSWYNVQNDYWNGLQMVLCVQPKILNRTVLYNLVHVTLNYFALYTNNIQPKIS